MASSLPDSPGLIETAFCKYVKAQVAGLGSALPFEPKQLPSQLPVVTMLYNGCEPADANDEIGPGRMIAWKWTIHVYVSLLDYRIAQTDMRSLCWQLVMLDKRDTSLLGSAPGGWSLLDGRSYDEPIFMPTDGVILKKLAMSAVTHESV